MKEPSYLKRKEKGFTLIELMVVIAIIGILAAIAIPQFNAYRQRSYESSAKTDLRNAYTSAHTFFVDSPAGTLTDAILASYGFRSTTGVTTTIAAGDLGNLSITSIHTAGGKLFTVNSNGTITP